MRVRQREGHGFTPVRRSAEHGFTLVEVMVALMVFGMIAAAGVAILSFSVRAQGATAAALDDLGAVERLSAIMTADLAQAVDRPTRDASGATLPAFEGDAGPLVRLVRDGWTNVDEAPRASLQKVEYRLDGGALERVGYPALDGAAPLPPAVLVEHVAAATMRWRYAGAWSDRWLASEAPAVLPQAAELTILVGEGGAQRSYRMLFLVGSGDRPAPRATSTPGASPVPGIGGPPPVIPPPSADARS